MAIAFLVIAAAVLGAAALRRMRFADRGEAAGYSLAVGLSIAAAILMAAGHYSLAGAGWLLLAVTVLGAMWLWRRGGPDRCDTVDGVAGSWTWMERLGLAAVLGALLLTLVGAMAPLTGWDATTAHLALPKVYAGADRMMLTEGIPYSAYPHLGHTLFTQTFRWGGERESMLLGWLFGVLACLAAYELGRALSNRCGGLVTAAMLATSPIFMDQGATVSVDIPFVAWTLLGVAALVKWQDRGEVGWLLVGGFLLGASCGIRHTGYVTSGLAGLAVVWMCRKDPRALAGFVAMGVAGALPWMLRSAVLVGNPVYPLFVSLFPGNPLPDMEHARMGAHESLRGTGLLDLLAYPVELFLRPDAFDGWSKSPGGLVLVFAPVGLCVGGRRVRVLGALALAGITFFFFFQQFTRYLLPFMGILMAVGAVGACRLRRWHRVIVMVLALFFVYGLALHAAAVHFKVPVAVGLESREDYLRSRVERYAVFEWVNEHVEKDACVLSLDARSYYLDGCSYSNIPGMLGMAQASADELRGWLAARGIRWALVPEAILEEGRFDGRPVGPAIGWWFEQQGLFELRRVFRLADRGSRERVLVYEVKPVPDGASEEGNHVLEKTETDTRRSL